MSAERDDAADGLVLQDFTTLETAVGNYRAIDPTALANLKRNLQKLSAERQAHWLTELARIGVVS
jgi:hypothetical protein